MAKIPRKLRYAPSSVRARSGNRTVRMTAHLPPSRVPTGDLHTDIIDPFVRTVLDGFEDIVKSLWQEFTKDMRKPGATKRFLEDAEKHGDKMIEGWKKSFRDEVEQRMRERETKGKQ